MFGSRGVIVRKDDHGLTIERFAKFISPFSCALSVGCSDVWPEEARRFKRRIKRIRRLFALANPNRFRSQKVGKSLQHAPRAIEFVEPCVGVFWVGHSLENFLPGLIIQPPHLEKKRA